MGSHNRMAANPQPHSSSIAMRLFRNPERRVRRGVAAVLGSSMDARPKIADARSFPQLRRGSQCSRHRKRDQIQGRILDRTTANSRNPLEHRSKISYFRDADDAAIPAPQGPISGYAPLLPDGRLLRALL